MMTFDDPVTLHVGHHPDLAYPRPVDRLMTEPALATRR